jgi:superfamily II DNA helicase RecQ
MAIVEQTQSGKTCGHKRCEFKAEIESVFANLNTPHSGQLNSNTLKSIEASVKINEILLAQRSSIWQMKAQLISLLPTEVLSTRPLNTTAENQTAIEIENRNGLVLSLLRRIELSVNNILRLITQLEFKESQPYNKQTMAEAKKSRTAEPNKLHETLIELKRNVLALYPYALCAFSPTLLSLKKNCLSFIDDMRHRMLEVVEDIKKISIKICGTRTNLNSF